jgi:hypothetical protein
MKFSKYSFTKDRMMGGDLVLDPTRVECSHGRPSWVSCYAHDGVRTPAMRIYGFSLSVDPQPTVRIPPRVNL